MALAVGSHSAPASGDGLSLRGVSGLGAVAERVFALLLLVVSGPVILVAAAAVKLTSRGPVLYRQTRVGRHGRPYPLYKLRTMVHDCERLSGPRWSVPGDPRVTRVGRVLRKTHVDELPQLWNVVCGHMSLVGPRPERPEFVERLQEAVPGYCERLGVRPGITGLAQLLLPPDTDLESVRRKVAYDQHYIRHRNAWLDFGIILCTAFPLLGLSRVPRLLFRVPSLEEEPSEDCLGGLPQVVLPPGAP